MLLKMTPNKYFRVNVIIKVRIKLIRFTNTNLTIWLNNEFLLKTKTYFRISTKAVDIPTKKESNIDISYEKKFEKKIRLKTFANAANPPETQNFMICLKFIFNKKLSSTKY